MRAAVIRPARYGAPRQAIQIEQLPVRTPGAGEVLVRMIAAGVNYNTVWAAMGYPVDVIAARNRSGSIEDFHVGGSEGAGVVDAVGEGVAAFLPGDPVIVLSSVWDANDPHIRAGGEPLYSLTLRAFGYETNFGTFAEYCCVAERQCLPKPANLTWEEAATCTLCGATAYRMLFGWPPNVCGKDSLVFVWGAAGGLGSMAVQLAREAGARIIAAASGQKRCAFLTELGADLVIDRTLYKDAEGLASLIRQEFGNLPDLVFEHPGQETLPLSFAVCRPGGMVVTCAGSSGYLASAPMPDFALGQKRFQGSHYATDRECSEFLSVVKGGRIKPLVSAVYPLAQIGEAHQQLSDNLHGPGSIAIRIAEAYAV